MGSKKKLLTAWCRTCVKTVVDASSLVKVMTSSRERANVSIDEDRLLKRNCGEEHSKYSENALLSLYLARLS
jgi:hypothetical protein